MKLEFDLSNISVTEFGVGRDEDKGQSFVAILVDGQVQGALREMATTTWEAMEADSDNPTKYDPSEKHSGTEYLYLPLGEELAASVRELHQAANLPLEAQALSDPTALFCYFARMTDNKKRRLTALRRASQFKGLLKSRLIRLVSDALRLVDDRVFKIDNDFDLLIDSKNIHILRPSGFEFAGKLQEAIRAAVPQNMKAIQRDLTYVDFENIEAYARAHSRAARYLASIRSQKETKDIDKAALKKLCKNTGVDVGERDGKLRIPDEQIMGFLEVLDRRRYELELVKGSPERFKAASRSKIDAAGEAK